KNIDVAAVGAPARYARREVLVRVGDPAVVFFFKAILIGFGIGIPEIKQGLDELVALFVGTKAQKSLAFLLCDDVDEVFVEYTPVGWTYLSPKVLVLLFALLGSKWMKGGIVLGRRFLRHAAAGEKE